MSTTNDGALIYADPFSLPATTPRYDAGEVLAALEGALVNGQTGMGSGFSSFHHTRVGQSHLLDEQELRALYRNNWWIRRIIDTPAFDMTRKGVTVKLLDDGDPELVAKITAKYNDTNPTDSPFESEYSIDQAKAEAVRWGRQFGRAYIVVHCNKGEDPSKPLKRVRSFDGVTVLDCYQLTPAPDEFNYYNPTYYTISSTRDAGNKDKGNGFGWGQRIHRSRVLPYDGNRIHPYDVQINGTGGHDSVVQCVFEIFTRYYQCNESVAEAMQSFSLFVANINNLSGIIAGKDGLTKLTKYLKELNTQRSVYRTVVQDGQSSSGDFVERSFAGVAENIKHFADEVTAASDLPHYKVWGSESNTNALSGGGAESRAYAEKVAGWQYQQLHPNDRRLFKMLFAELGDIPRFDIEYPSIYQPTPQEEEEIKAKQAERYATLSREGIILPLQGRLALATNQDIENVLDAEEIQKELERLKDVEAKELDQSVDAATNLGGDEQPGSIIEEPGQPRDDSQYSHISFTPPQGVIDAAKRALRATESGQLKIGDGMEPATKAWVRRVAKGEAVTPAKAKQGYRWFKRNARFKDAPKDSSAWAAWAYWFGDAGQGWFNKLWRQMEAAERANLDNSGEEWREDKRSCKKGVPCGNSCIARNKKCRKKLTGKTLAKAKAVNKPKPVKNKVAELSAALENRDFDKAAVIADDIYQSARARATAAGGDFYEGISAGNNSTEDWILKEIYSQQGYDKKPRQVKTAAGITRAYNNGQVVAYRAMGSTDARFNQHFDNFKNGDYFAGHGIYGHGTYVAYAVQGGTHSRQTAVNAASPYGSGVMRIALAKNANIVDQSDHQNDVRAMDSMLKSWYRQSGDRQAYRRLRRVTIGDDAGDSTSGRLAAIQGRDAIRLNMAYDTTYMNLLNRSKVTVQSTPGTLYKQ